MDRSFGRCRDLRVQSRNAQASESLHNSPFGALVQFVQRIAGRAVGHKLLCTGHRRANSPQLTFNPFYILLHSHSLLLF